jgi:hypothetical protein
MAAGNAIIAHDNLFNRWVAGPQAKYFNSIDELSTHFASLLSDSQELKNMQAASRVQHAQNFQQDDVLGAYERLLMNLPMGSTRWELSEKSDDSGQNITAVAM